jgi:hypothetical protein
MGRNRRGSRQASMKARLSIAAAVLVGGGAIGAVAFATSNHSAAPSTTAATSAGYYWNTPRHNQMSVGNALSTALASWNTSQWTSMTTLTRMAPMRNFATAQMRHTTFAAQRGVVVLATRHLLLVQSANGSLHLWLIGHNTAVQNVATSTTGTTAMTGSTQAATAATTLGTLAPAAQTMAGSTTAVTQMTAPVAKPTTITIAVAGTNQVITITIANTTAAVTPSGTSAAVTTGIPVTTSVVPVMAVNNHIARGDLVFVAGVMTRHQLIAQLVLFTPPTTVTPTPTATVPVLPTSTATVPVVTPTAPTGVTPTATMTFSGAKS